MVAPREDETSPRIVLSDAEAQRVPPQHLRFLRPWTVGFLATLSLLSLCSGAGARWSTPVQISNRGQASEDIVSNDSLGEDGLFRVVWAQGHSLNLALVDARGHILRRTRFARLSEPAARPSSSAPLARGRTLTAWEAGKRFNIATFDRAGRRLHLRSFRGGFGGTPTPPLIALANGGAMACWTRHDTPSLHEYRDRIFLAIVSPKGAIQRVLTVADSAPTGSRPLDCGLAAAGSHAAVMWDAAQDHNAQVFLRRISADGSLADPIAVRPSGDANWRGGSSTFSIASTGTIAVAWEYTSSDGREGQQRMRWIASDDVLGPVARLEALHHGIPTDAYMAAAGTGQAVAVLSRGRSILSEEVDSEGRIGKRVTLFRGNALPAPPVTNSRKIALAWQARGDGKSSIYDADWIRGRWGRPTRIWRGGPTSWPAWPKVAMNPRGQVGIAVDISTPAYPFTLGVRAAFGF